MENTNEEILNKPLRGITGNDVSVLMQMFDAPAAAWLDFQMDVLFRAEYWETNYSQGVNYYPEYGVTVNDIFDFLQEVQDRINGSADNYTNGDYNKGEELERVLRSWSMAYHYYKQWKERNERYVLYYVQANEVKELQNILDEANRVNFDLRFERLFEYQSDGQRLQVRRGARVDEAMELIKWADKRILDADEPKPKTNPWGLECLRYFQLNKSPKEPQPTESSAPTDDEADAPTETETQEQEQVGETYAPNKTGKKVEASETDASCSNDFITDAIRPYFDKAVAAGYMSKTETGYKWHKSNALLAYFCGHIWCKDSIKTSNGKSTVSSTGGAEPLPEKKLCELFGVSNLSQSRLQISGNSPRGIKDLETAIFQ